MAIALAGLVRLSRQPPQAMVLAPGDAFNTVRTAQLAAATIPAVEAKALDLRRELASLADARLRLDEERAATAQALANWTLERERMGALQGDAIAAWRRALADHEKESRNAAHLAESAKDLQTLLSRLAEAERQKERLAGEEQMALKMPPPPGPPTLQRSTPARGRVVARFGDSDGLGGKLKGVRIETRNLSPVVAPSDGKVAYAGQFRGYGLLLIIEHDGGYHTLLGGLARIDSLVGQWVLAGEPVGEMGDDRTGKPSLYVEIRHKGEPVNPLPWLASGDRKVSG
jgi:septal ring factor EnvC (AmiA/AmiB activator)